jgi:arsenate reductase
MFVAFSNFFDKIIIFRLNFLCTKKMQTIMNKIYYIASCDTCRKIIKSLPKGNDLVFRDIKQDPLTAEELEIKLKGSYEALFSKSPVV